MQSDTRNYCGLDGQFIKKEQNNTVFLKSGLVRALSVCKGLHSMYTQSIKMYGNVAIHVKI